VNNWITNASNWGGAILINSGA